MIGAAFADHTRKNDEYMWSGMFDTKTTPQILKFKQGQKDM